MRYIAPPLIGSTARAGKHLEQWLGVRQSDAGFVLRYVIISPGRGMFLATLYEVYDEGHDDYRDLYGFTCASPESDFVEQVECDTAEAAVEHACQAWSATPDRFCSTGMLQDEYADHLKRLGGRPGPQA